MTTSSRRRRWALSPRDMRSHLLADDGRDPIGIVLAICGHVMPNSVDTGPQPTATRCEACDPRPALDVSAPQFRTRNSGDHEEDLGWLGSAL